MNRVEIDCINKQEVIVVLTPKEEADWTKDRQTRLTIWLADERRRRAGALNYAEVELQKAVQLRQQGTFNDADVSTFQKLRDDAFSDFWAITQEQIPE